MNAIWAVRSLGIDPATGDEIFLTKDGETTTEWKAEDQVVCGDAMPECSGTFGINMDYRGIFLRDHGSQVSTHYGSVIHSSTGLGQLQGDALRKNWEIF